jgi:hypothetical protein
MAPIFAGLHHDGIRKTGGQTYLPFVGHVPHPISEAAAAAIHSSRNVKFFLQEGKMRSHTKTVLIVGCVALLLAGTALGDGVEVKITNDGTQDIVVTVYDMSTSPERIVLPNARINGFTSVPVSLISDATGKGNLAWTAVNTDSVTPKCGRAATVVDNAASVSVRADSNCRD